MAGSRDENVYMARLAEQAERYEDMVNYMKRVAEMGAELSEEERNLLSVAFKNAVGARRQANRQIIQGLAHEPTDGSNPHIESIHNYRKKIEDELNGKCDEILLLLSNASGKGIQRPSTKDDAEVFYLKMEGDYYRYKAEAAGRDENSTKAHEKYYAATEVASRSLPACHAIRLGLALNFSVFFYEVKGLKDEACSVAKGAYDAAYAESQSNGDVLGDNPDARQIMELLRDNLILWQSQTGQGDGKPPEQDGTLCEDL